ncbi:hypothetical protein DFH09DRAFT_1067800 [Mycena vulgaris]|nr:hypothetical protein DFH09DRAFT_1067800 [Mycena vulgaris]
MERVRGGNWREGSRKRTTDSARGWEFNADTHGPRIVSTDESWRAVVEVEKSLDSTKVEGVGVGETNRAGRAMCSAGPKKLRSDEYEQQSSGINIPASKPATRDTDKSDIQPGCNNLLKPDVIQCLRELTEEASTSITESRFFPPPGAREDSQAHPTPPRSPERRASICTGPAQTETQEEISPLTHPHVPSRGPSLSYTSHLSRLRRQESEHEEGRWEGDEIVREGDGTRGRPDDNGADAHQPARLQSPRTLREYCHAQPRIWRIGSLAGGAVDSGGKDVATRIFASYLKI